MNSHLQRARIHAAEDRARLATYDWLSGKIYEPVNPFPFWHAAESLAWTFEKLRVENKVRYHYETN